MNFEGFKDDTVYPVSASAGGNNAYHHACDVTGYRPGYCVCVNKLMAYESGRRDFLPECVTAIQYGTCPAKQMRREEVEKGQALYFVNREKLLAARQEKWDQQDQARRAAIGIQPARRPQPAFATLPKDDSKANKGAPRSASQPAPKTAPTADFAAAINRAIAESVKSDNPATFDPASGAIAVEASPEPVVATAGKSLREIALAKLKAAQA